jgi:hypothetical protein
VNNEQRLLELRELFLSAPESAVTRALGIALSLALVGIVLWLVKRRSLREEYTPIWLAAAVAVLCVSVSAPLMKWIMHAVGAWTASSVLFFFGEIFLVAICLNYAVRLSRITLQLKNLTQELAILRSERESDRSPSHIA